MDPALLEKLIKIPITITLSAYQFGLLIRWLEVEMLGRTVKMGPKEPDSQDDAEAAQHLRELDEILAAIRDAYRQTAAKLNIAIDR